jgi:hypothetical protein
MRHKKYAAKLLELDSAECGSQEVREMLAERGLQLPRTRCDLEV